MIIFSVHSLSVQHKRLEKNSKPTREDFHVIDGFYSDELRLLL